MILKRLAASIPIALVLFCVANAASAQVVLGQNNASTTETAAGSGPGVGQYLGNVGGSGTTTINDYYSYATFHNYYFGSGYTTLQAIVCSQAPASTTPYNFINWQSQAGQDCYSIATTTEVFTDSSWDGFEGYLHWDNLGWDIGASHPYAAIMYGTGSFWHNAGNGGCAIGTCGSWEGTMDGSGSYGNVYTTIGDVAFSVNETPADLPAPDTSTHIIDFTPEDGATVSGPNVNFTLHAYINPADIGGMFKIQLTLHNIDQNVLLASAFSPSDVFLLQNVVATTSGDFYYSTTTTIADGNYRINAIMQQLALWGWIKDPFSSVNQNLSHQFIVGDATLLGSLTQNGFSELNGLLASTTATSSVSLIQNNCNPFSGFNMALCLTGLFVPDTTALNTTITGFQKGVLQRAPWGYFSRVYAILNSTATTSLPSYTVNLAMNTASDTTTLAFNPGDMIAGGGALLATVQDPYDHKTLKDIAEPIVQLLVALSVLFTIISDITGSHKNQAAADTRSRNTRRV